MQEEKKLTASPPRANSPITWVLTIATNVPHSRLQQALPIKMFAEEMFDAPETTRSYCAFLRIWRKVLRCSVGVEGHAGGLSEGAEETGYEVGELGCH